MSKRSIAPSYVVTRIKRFHSATLKPGRSRSKISSNISSIPSTWTKHSKCSQAGKLKDKRSNVTNKLNMDHDIKLKNHIATERSFRNPYYRTVQVYCAPCKINPCDPCNVQCPVLEIKVDKRNMRVVNSNQIKNVVKCRGKYSTKPVCVCPSQKQKYANFKNVCPKGACATALEKNRPGFICRCQKNTSCSDSVCTRCRRPCAFKKDHMFKLLLNYPHMDVVNETEIQDMFNIAQEGGYCPEGVCHVTGLDSSGRKAECRCIRKKLMWPDLTCDDRTCQLKEKAAKLTAKKDEKKAEKEYQKKEKEKKKKVSEQVKEKEKEKENKKKLKDQQLKDLPKIKGNESIPPPKRFPLNKTDLLEAKEKHEAIYDLEHQKAVAHDEKESKALDVKRKKEELEWNALSDKTAGVVNITGATLKAVAKGFITIFTNPIQAYVYTKKSIKDVNGVSTRLKYWASVKWKQRDGKISQFIKNSDAIRIVSDTVENSKVYKAVVSKNDKKKEELIELRMKKRDQEAIYGCKHVLLLTLRKTPCFMCYHLFPNFYPQCLSLITLLKSFMEVIFYTAAAMCWTPCICMMEACRGCMCV